MDIFFALLVNNAGNFLFLNSCLKASSFIQRVRFKDLHPDF